VVAAALSAVHGAATAPHSPHSGLAPVALLAFTFILVFIFIFVAIFRKSRFVFPRAVVIVIVC
jgi:hypothetical protein